MANMRTFARQNDIVYWQILEGIGGMLLIITSPEHYRNSILKMLRFYFIPFTLKFNYLTSYNFKYI